MAHGFSKTPRNKININMKCCFLLHFTYKPNAFHLKCLTISTGSSWAGWDDGCGARFKAQQWQLGGAHTPLISSFTFQSCIQSFSRSAVRPISRGLRALLKGQIETAFWCQDSNPYSANQEPRTLINWAELPENALCRTCGSLWLSNLYLYSKELVVLKLNTASFYPIVYSGLHAKAHITAVISPCALTNLEKCHSFEKPQNPFET